MLDFFRVRTVAGCGVPVSRRDMDELARHNIRAVLSLTEQPLPADMTAGFRTLHAPVRDFTAPTIAQLHQCVEFLDTCLADGVPPVVHCAMGRGRTGTVLAAWLITQGETTMAAIREVRCARPGAIETDDQENILYDFEIDVRRTQEGSSRRRRQ